ncbi:MAG TPA: recombinase family protein [Dehalococcoidia bacterium]|nr:recombinase family protein [Dehalococcoidia bacterium]
MLDSYYDEAVSGADPVTSRPGFAAAMERIASNGVRTITVETANRFARDLIVQETGFVMLKGQGIELIAADKPDASLDDTPTANLIRQVLGAVSHFEKGMVVSKLKGARDRKRRETGKKVEGRKSYVEMNPELVRLIRPTAGAGRCGLSRRPSPRRAHWDKGTSTGSRTSRCLTTWSNWTTRSSRPSRRGVSQKRRFGSDRRRMMPTTA